MNSKHSTYLVLVALWWTPLMPAQQDARPSPDVPRVEHRPSRDLPADRTVFTLEIPEPRLMWDARAELFQTRAYDNRSLRRAIADFGVGAQARERTELLSKFFGSYDQGLTVAAVFGQKKGGPHSFYGFVREPWLCLIGASSEAQKVRELPAIVHGIVKDQPAEHDLERVPLLDSPVYIRAIDGRVFDAYRSRRGALTMRPWDTDEKTGPSEIVAECLGMVRRSKPRLRPAAPADERVLMRMRYTPKAIDSQKKSFFARYGICRAILGIDAIQAIDGRLSFRKQEEDRKIFERIDVHPVPKRKTVLDCFQHDARPHAQRIAELLPADTIALATLRVDGAELGRQVDVVLRATGFVRNDYMTELRRALGLRARDGARLEGLEGLTLAIVPSKSPADDKQAEVVVLVHGDLADDAARMAIEEHARRTWSLLPEDERVEQIREAKGIYWLEAGALHKRGQYGSEAIAVGRSGRSLIFATSRQALTALLAREPVQSLAREKRFRADMEGSTEHEVAAYGFVDGPRFLRAALRDRRLEFAWPLFAFLPDSKNLDADELAKLTSRESFSLRREDGFHRFEHEGGTLFSPTAWAAAGIAGRMAYLLDQVPQGPASRSKR